MTDDKVCLYILLPVHNRRGVTEKFINCLANQSISNYHLVLIDDGSSDGTAEMVGKRIRNLTILTGEGDWWWAGSLQRGIDWLNGRAAGNDIILFINDDVIFESDFLHKGICMLDQYGGMLLPQVLNSDTGEISESGVEADMKTLTFRPAREPEKINCLPTRGLFMRMSVLLQVGGFFPKLLPHYLSDYEFTIRAHRLGVGLSTSPHLLIEFDRETTGYRTFEGASYIDFLRKYFSIKSVVNPVYWSTFVLLTVPKRYILKHLVLIWIRAVRAMTYALFHNNRY